MFKNDNEPHTVYNASYTMQYCMSFLFGTRNKYSQISGHFSERVAGTLLSLNKSSYGLSSFGVFSMSSPTSEPFAQQNIETQTD